MLKEDVNSMNGKIDHLLEAFQDMARGQEGLYQVAFRKVIPKVSSTIIPPPESGFPFGFISPKGHGVPPLVKN